MTFPQPFLAWVARNWNAGARFTVDDLADLHDQWEQEGGPA